METPGTSVPRVVLVEDDPTVRVAVERYLGANGYLVDAFGAPPGGDPLIYVRETIESLEAAGALSRL